MNKDINFNKNQNLLEYSPIYKPFYYQWAYDAWKTQQQLHWMPYEVMMSQDILDWHKLLNENEKSILNNIFRFFTQADIIVNNSYINLFLKVFKPIEVQMMLTAFANIETIHIDGYSFLMETIGMKDEEYSAFLQYKEMMDKYNYLQIFNINNKFEIARSLAAFSAFTEGLQLFSTFAILLNFQRFNKMKGMCQIVAWSMRDETLHIVSMIKLFKTFLNENKDDIDIIKLEKDIYEICRNIVNYEIKFIDLVFNIGEPEGLSKQNLIDYIHFIANFRLKDMGFKPIFNIHTNPLPWMDYVMGIEFTNFFENKPTEYSKSSTTGTWDEAF